MGDDASLSRAAGTVRGKDAASQSHSDSNRDVVPVTPPANAPLGIVSLAPQVSDGSVPRHARLVDRERLYRLLNHRPRAVTSLHGLT